MLGSVKDVLVGRAMQLMRDPRMTRLMGDPRVMNAAMKALNLGGSVKTELDKAARFAAGLLGVATQEEVSALRSTIQHLEDTVAILETKTATSTTAATAAPPRRAPAGS